MGRKKASKRFLTRRKREAHGAHGEKEISGASRLRPIECCVKRNKFFSMAFRVPSLFLRVKKLLACDRLDQRQTVDRPEYPPRPGFNIFGLAQPFLSSLSTEPALSQRAAHVFGRIGGRIDRRFKRQVDRARQQMQAATPGAVTLVAKDRRS